MSEDEQDYLAVEAEADQDYAQAQSNLDTYIHQMWHGRIHLAELGDPVYSQIATHHMLELLTQAQPDPEAREYLLTEMLVVSIIRAGFEAKTCLEMDHLSVDPDDVAVPNDVSSLE